MVQECIFFYLAQQFPLHKQVKEFTLGNMILHQGKLGWIVSQLIDSKPLDVAAYQAATKSGTLNTRVIVGTFCDNPQCGTLPTLCFASLL